MKINKNRPYVYKKEFKRGRYKIVKIMKNKENLKTESRAFRIYDTTFEALQELKKGKRGGYAQLFDDLVNVYNEEAILISKIKTNLNRLKGLNKEAYHELLKNK